MEETAELGEVTAQADRPGYEPISSTLWRQREEYCAKMIQSVWRKQIKFTADMVPPPRGADNGFHPPPASASAWQPSEPQRNGGGESAAFNGNSQVISEVTERLERNMSKESEEKDTNRIETIVTLESER